MEQEIDKTSYPKIYFHNFESAIETIQKIKQNYINFIDLKSEFTKKYSIDNCEKNIKIFPKVVDTWDEANIVINYVDENLKKILELDYENKSIINICSSLNKNDTIEMLPPELANIFHFEPNTSREKIMDNKIVILPDTTPYMPLLSSRHSPPYKLQLAISKSIVVKLQNEYEQN